ncbi:MAG: PilZ domain-containing protein [Deltaproteobacteria bacterium]|nr:PilZ domain-containing protein [Deltaproteobacteria bacterium]MBW2076249.1 PilZ domain-containing protein [Deltaproteobacteria bacterium]MBW2309763.1 PilZ domain-containing protein [Deltaproteobacteria bacterium]
MNQEPDRRGFDRFPIALAIEVLGKGSDGRTQREKTTLRDISGEGARFITQHPDRYFQGQNLELVIYLPGTQEVQAQMRGKARVVRIGDSGTIAEGGGTSIAVKLFTSLQFKRAND